MLECDQRVRPFPHARTFFWPAPRVLVLGLLVLGLAGCVYLPRATQRPVPTIGSQGKGSPAASTLVVFLPGRWDRMDAYERHGFIAEMARAGVRADWLSVDAHPGYYRERSVVDRLHEDVLVPARARGYRRIVIVGISLGGLGALLSERDQPGKVDALVLIAPYLGQNKRLLAEIAATGGPAAWAVGHTPVEGVFETDLWTFLGKKNASLPPTWLAWGDKDSFAESHRLLAPLLPSDRLFTQPGAHDWETWQALWQQLCERSDLFADEKKAARLP